MPLRLPRRTLAAEIVVSLAIKVAALIAIAVFLFGADQRPEVTPATMDKTLTGDRS